MAKKKTRRLKYADCPSCRGVDPKSCAHQIIHARLDLPGFTEYMGIGDAVEDADLRFVLRHRFRNIKSGVTSDGVALIRSYRLATGQTKEVAARVIRRSVSLGDFIISDSAEEPA